MFISLNFFVRKSGVSWEEFSRHWREIHGPLLANTPTISRYIKRYVQHHLAPNESLPNVQPLAFDGIAELWFDSLEERQKMFAEPDFKRIVTPDTHRFLNLDVIRTSMSDTQVIQVGADFVPAIAAGATSVTFRSPTGSLTT